MEEEKTLSVHLVGNSCCVNNVHILAKHFESMIDKQATTRPRYFYIQQLYVSHNCKSGLLVTHKLEIGDLAEMWRQGSILVSVHLNLS